MFARYSYSPVRASSDSEGTLKSPAHKELPSWLVHRKIRAVVAASLFIPLLCLLLFRWPNTLGIHERIQEFAVHNTTSPAAMPAPSPVEAACNCSIVESSNDTPKEPAIDWSDFAYVQYVTNPSYLCNSLMILEALRRFETKADLLMMYPNYWTAAENSEENAAFERELLAKARDEYNVNLVPIEVKTYENKDDPTWQDSYTKLLAFNQTQYKRVISLDSDATVLDHMDELFLLPSTPIAMPRAYWMDKFFLSSQLIVIEPSSHEYRRVEEAMIHHEGHDYDMDILNKVYEKLSMVIPHRKYDLLTGEFKWHNKHENYLGNKEEKWEPRKALEEAKFVHFSDWPMPKPWLEPLSGMVEKFQPECWNVTGAEELDCGDREVWLELRSDFTKRRERICGRSYDGKAKQIPERRSTTRSFKRRPKYEPTFE